MPRRKVEKEGISVALLRAWEEGTVHNPVEVEEGVWTVGRFGHATEPDLVGFPLGTDAAAVELMQNMAGFMIAAPKSLTQVISSGGGTVATVVDVRRLPDIIAARKVWQDCTGLDCPWWSVPRIARAMLEWAAVAERDAECDEKIMPAGCWHHQSCTAPGRYRNLALYDVSAFYYNMLLRLRTPRVRNQEGKVWYTNDLKGQEAERWGRMLRAVADHKGLRNTLVGCMAGGDAQYPCYSSKGGTVPVYTYPMNKIKGPFRAAALWIVATGNELTRRQALLNGAIYANIDCVVIPSGRRLEPVWQAFGLPVSVKAEGKGEVCHIGSWRIGRQYTTPYATGARQYHAREVEPFPNLRYAERWLNRPSPWLQ